jgi:hypothetical protein
MDAASIKGTPAPCSAWRNMGASRPMSTTARVWRATTAAKVLRRAASTCND